MNNYKLLSILMPTYNDAETIVESLDSLLLQSNKNWELIIVNDGSTDETETVVKKYIRNNQLESKIKYFYQENQDQLRALMKASIYAKGDLVMFLHSDDVLSDDQAVERIFDNFKGEAILCDMNLIDENGKYIGRQTIPDVASREKTISQILLFLGRNIYADTFIATSKAFKEFVHKSYLSWNMPFYIDAFSEHSRMLDVRNVHQPVMSYRRHKSNYIQSEVGLLNVLNGELRTATALMNYLNIPFYKTQFYVYRFFKKIGVNYSPYFTNSPMKNRHNALRFILDKRFVNGRWRDNPFLLALDDFYRINSTRAVKLFIPKDEFIYKGCDMRRFNNDLINSSLSTFYSNLLDEMTKGFSEVICDDERVIDVLKFLCISHVKVRA